MSFPIHPYAELFPMHDDGGLDELCEDIKINGLHDDITLFNDMVLDGRGRQLACEKTGTEPRYSAFVGDDSAALAFVISKNLKRRHLTESQRAMVAARLATMPEGRPSETAQICAVKSQEKAAELLSVSRRSVQNATTVQEHGTEELQEAVNDGTVSVSDAAKVATQPPAKQRKAVKAVKEGKARTAAAAVNGQHKMLCASCDRKQRVGQIVPKGCPECKALNKPKETEKDEQPVGAAEEMMAANSAIESFCRGVMKYVNENLPEDAWLTVDNVREGAIRKFKDGCEMLRSKKCAAVCPICLGEKKQDGKKCRPCHGTGRVPKLQLDMMV